MTDTTVAPAAADAAVHPSQIIEHRDTSEVPRAGTLPEGEQPPKEAAKPLSTRDAIAKAFDEADKAAKGEKDAAKPEDAAAKPAPEDKAAKARAEDGKFAKVEKGAEPQPDAKAEQGAPVKSAAEQAAPERRTSEGRHPEPPARFLPEARAKWANVPNEVKAEFHRVAAEMETETKQYRASHERYTQLKDFDDLARSNGRDLRESLTKVNEIENALQRNPIAGLDAVLREVGPRRQDGSALTIMDVAQYLTQNPQAYQLGAPPSQSSQPAQQQPNPEIAELKATVESLVAEKAMQKVLPVVEQFADGKPDFEAVSEVMGNILKEGFVERLFGSGLSEEQRISQAYRMAGGQYLSSRSEPDPLPPHSEPPAQSRPVDPDGQKSIKGAPTAGQTGEPKWVPKTNREALERAFANVR